MLVRSFSLQSQSNVIGIDANINLFFLIVYTHTDYQRICDFVDSYILLNHLSAENFKISKERLQPLICTLSLHPCPCLSMSCSIYGYGIRVFEKNSASFNCYMAGMSSQGKTVPPTLHLAFPPVCFVAMMQT